MKKLLSLLAFLLLGFSPSYAGTMGDAEPLPFLIPFFAGEALYTWPEIQGFNIHIDGRGTLRSKEINDGWGGRLALGAIHPLTEILGVSAEFGFGYYGQVKTQPIVTLDSAPDLSVLPPGEALFMKINQYGLDVLGGLIYMQPKYDLFIKAGALVQNLRFLGALNYQKLTGDTTSTLAQRLNGRYTIRTTLANALPELRLGGGYHVTDDWLFTASWMHAFGSTLALSAPTAGVGNGTQVGHAGDVSAKLSAPPINVVMFGLEYRFM